ncbi:MAG: UDP-N-acetylmuramoyl-tripeptide--D-alanyl-D-alanine ligase [Bacteroidia bacterium]|nr:UDP-N-acetylmuramoyl-tripeptide--D-alanyl-D-alanine ligase [Bacteroidia bacterium]
MEFHPTDQIYAAFRKHAGICTDTRKLIKGGIFFALKGGQFNGNLFAEKALEQGCTLAVVDDPSVVKGKKYFLVEDVLKTLQDLAKFHRSLLKIPFIGLTGSNGKTTTKELIRAVLSRRFKTFATEGNLNNHIGVPLSVLSVTDDSEIAVIEMGANHQGEIAALCEICAPDYGIITNIGKAHLEGFGGPEGVIRAKSELYQYIEQHSGKIFLNRDNPVLTGLIKKADTFTYGTSGLCNILGRQAGNGPLLSVRWKTNNDNAPLEEHSPVQTNLTGIYNLENVLAAIAVGTVFGIPAQEINAGISSYMPGNHRSQVKETDRNTLILDSYNANPTSMRAALENLSGMEGDKMVVLGDMLELGDHSYKEHAEILHLVREKGFGQCILVGPAFTKAITGMKDAPSCDAFENTSEAQTKMKSKLSKLRRHLVLIKGSRGIKLEDLESLF